MSFTVRIDSRTLIMLLGAVIGLLLLWDIHNRRQAAPALMANAGVQERVVTKEFVLVDDNGTTRARIGMNELNAPAVTLFDKTGNTRALLRLNQDDVPSLRLFDSVGTMREGLGFAQGTLEPHLWFFDQNGQTNELIPAASSVSANALLYRNSAPITTTPLRRGVTYQSTIQWNDKTVPGSAFIYRTEDLNR